MRQMDPPTPPNLGTPNPFLNGWKEELRRIWFWVFGGEYEQRSKMRMIFREGILNCQGKIKWRWKRKFITGEHNRERKTRKKFGDGKYVFFCRGED